MKGPGDPGKCLPLLPVVLLLAAPIEMESFNLEALKKKLQDIGEKDSQPTSSEELSFPVLRRLHALDTLHAQRRAISKELRNEILKLERQYSEKIAAVYRERYLITSGKREPTASELEGFSESGVQEVGGDEVKGIPNFWLNALRNHPHISPTITEADAKALVHLKDVRVALLAETPGFRLEFEFEPNDYFENKVLTKEYRLASPDDCGFSEEFEYDYATGTKISWKAGRSLCFKTVVRTQKHRTQKTTRTVRREEPTESFFHFFDPPQMPEGKEQEDEEMLEEDELEELETRIRADYEIGEAIKDHVVPMAAEWFTGDALNYIDLEENDDDYDDDDYDEEDYDDEDEDEDEDDEDEDEDEIATHSDEEPSRQRFAAKKGDGKPSSRAPSSNAVEKPECKQQ